MRGNPVGVRWRDAGLTMPASLGVTRGTGRPTRAMRWVLDAAWAPLFPALALLFLVGRIAGAVRFARAGRRRGRAGQVSGRHLGEKM